MLDRRCDTAFDLRYASVAATYLTPLKNDTIVKVLKKTCWDNIIINYANKCDSWIAKEVEKLLIIK